MAKVVFILQGESGTTRHECLDRWAGEQHAAIVRRLPGLTGVASAPCCLRTGRARSQRWNRRVVV
jgi:hypothetical protein